MKNINKLSLDPSILDDEVSEMERDIEHEIVYDLPPEEGSLRGLFLDMSNDVALYRGEYLFNQHNKQHEYSFGNLNIAYAEDTFAAHIALGGLIRLEENLENNKTKEIIFGRETTYFRYDREYKQDVFIETSKEIINTALTIPMSSMKLLLGEEVAQNLLVFLSIQELPGTALHKIPMRITQILNSAINPHLTGSMKKLYCQAKALEYLCELVELMEKKELGSHSLKQGQSLISEIHNQLLNHTGRLPTLAELAKQHAVPARTLNTLFEKEYGLTISQYMTRTRLEKAREVIINSDVPLKVIADKLGYSHVNHFITAFKREFGYPPGSLRK